MNILDTYKVRSAKMRKCENKQCIECEMESAKWGCESMYKMRNCEKGFDLRFDLLITVLIIY